VEEKELGISYCTFEELLKNSDIISLHASLNASTKHVINIESLKQMKSSSYLINTSRGQLVDEPALVEALNKRIIRGAALDVFEKEPFDASNGLFQCENVILTPHIGGVTTESFTEMMRAAFKNIELFHNGFQTEIEHKRVKL
jgi:phosphoglycerate dehydrogenase-like enzyme